MLRVWAVGVGGSTRGSAGACNPQGSQYPNAAFSTQLSDGSSTALAMWGQGRGRPGAVLWGEDNPGFPG